MIQLYRGYHFTIYLPLQLAQYSYLPTYLPAAVKKCGGDVTVEGILYMYSCNQST